MNFGGIRQGIESGARSAYSFAKELPGKAVDFAKEIPAKAQELWGKLGDGIEKSAINSS